MENDPVQFELSESGRTQLETISRRCEEYAQTYDTLRYQRLVTWSGRGHVRTSEAHWEAFLAAQDESAFEHDWFRWDGPHRCMFGLWLGMWLGSPDGLDEFGELCGSIAKVLQTEDPPTINIRDEIGAWRQDQWIWQMHDWSSRFDIPGLQSDVFIWDSDVDANEEPSEFVEIAERWRLGKSGPYPEHPFVWRFVDNIFTASATALRAILNPLPVAEMNDGWEEEMLPYIGRVRAVVPPAIPAHRIIQFEKNWSVRLDGADEARPISNKTGIERIAYLIDICPGKLHANDLTNHGGYTAKARSMKRSDVTVRGDVSTHRAKPQTPDKQTVDAALDSYEEIALQREEAEANEDMSGIKKCDVLRQLVRREYGVDESGAIVGSQEEDSRQEARKPIRAASGSIDRAIAEIQSFDTIAGKELDAQVMYDNGVFWFDLNDEVTPWVVERSETGK